MDGRIQGWVKVARTELGEPPKLQYSPQWLSQNASGLTVEVCSNFNLAKTPPNAGDVLYTQPVRNPLRNYLLRM